MKNKIKKIVTILFFIVISVASCIYIYNKFKDNKDNNNALKFAQEYKSVDANNKFIYKTGEEIIKVLEKGTGIVYLGFPECPWCQAYVKIIDDVAKDTDTDIYYFNVFEDRKNNTETYKKLVSILSGGLQHDKDGNERIFVPHLAVVINGKIIESDYETSLDTGGFEDPNLYWTNDKIENLKNKLKVPFEKVFTDLNSCNECN